MIVVSEWKMTWREEGIEANRTLKSYLNREETSQKKKGGINK